MSSVPAARPIRVVLIGFSTRSDNLGVGALTVSQVDILRSIARDLGRSIEITVVDPKGPRTPYVEGPDIRIVDLDRSLMVSPAGYLALARRADLVIDIGAGDSFADIYGTGRLRRMFVLKFLTHLAGTPLVLAPQTIGPFTRGWSKRLALASIRRSAIVATRDALSTQALRELGYDGTVVEASDVALRLPYEPAPPRPAGGPPRVGINISGLLMNGGYTRKNEFGIVLDYHRLIRDLIGFFRAEGAEVHLVAHVLPEDPARTHIEDDFAACADLATAFPGTVLAPRFASPSTAKTYIADLDFFVGARMHACIAAFSAGVPVVPMAYSRKFAGLFGSLGYDRTVDCAAETGDVIWTKVVAAWADSSEVAGETERALALGHERLAAYAAALRQYLQKTLVP
jgi:polysaccharide pyruvyl transferase WcaK-like protein